MKIHLHVGWHKTGTTAIQRCLHNNRDALFERYGIYHPQTGLVNSGHHALAWSLQDKGRSAWARKAGFQGQAEVLFEQMLEEAGQRKAARVIISSEAFSLITSYILGRLADLLRGHDVQVIAYVRRQDSYIESLYNTRVKTSVGRIQTSLDQFAANRIASGELDYYEHFTQWASHFGNDALMIRPYDRSTLQGGDVCADLLGLLGITKAEEIELPARDVNESMSFISIQFLKRMNVIPLSDTQHVRLVRILRQLERERGDKNRTLLSVEERLHIYAHFRESNRKFARQFHIANGGLELTIDELLADAALELDYTNEHFMVMLTEVLPRLLGARNGAGSGKDAARGKQVGRTVGKNE